MYVNRLSKSVLAVCLAACFACAPASADPAKVVAFLGVQFLNDHESLEPTTAAERRRVAAAGDDFKTKLEASGRYSFAPVSAEAKQRIDAGAVIGSCGGCEFQYGQQIGGQLVAWLVVQKVSDLILNMNVYIGDVATGKLTLVHSVDIRGNTDESWTRGVNYLVKNFVLKDAG
jgi:Protein of unknown function (DUF2380)